jgi:putative transposase
MRLARLYAPGLPQLVQASFAPKLIQAWHRAPERAPFGLIADWLRQFALAEGVRLHGWSISPQALILLATPAHRQSISRLIQSVGRHLSAHLKNGGVFDGRYRNAVLEPGQWVLPALVWLETAPVSTGCAPTPLAWRWSSAAQHCGEPEASRAWVQDHHDYWSCGNTPFDRQARYRALLLQGLDLAQRQQIESSLKGQWVLGSTVFARGLENVASRRPTPGQRGRPRKTVTDTPTTKYDTPGCEVL